MQTIKLDLGRYDVPQTIFAKQADVGRKFQAVLMDNERKFEIPVGSMLTMWYSGTSGEGNYSEIDDRSAFSVDGNTVTVELITQMLKNKGGGTFCLMLHGADGSQIAMWNVPYVVEAVPGVESDGAETFYTAFSKAVEQLPYPDASLSLRGKAADAKATGDAIASVCLQASEESGVVTLELGGHFDGDGSVGFAVSPTIEVTKINGGHKVTVTDVEGGKSFDVLDGITPVKGIDYYTNEDKQEMIEAVLAALPAAEGVAY